MNIQIFPTSVRLRAEGAAETVQLMTIRREATRHKFKWKFLTAELGGEPGLEISLKRPLLTDEQAKMLFGLLETA